MTDGAPLTINVAKAHELIPLLYRQFNHSPDGIFGHRDMPEEILPETVQEGSLEHVIFITLTVSIDYQRDAPALWQSGRRTINDPETCWLYNAKEVAGRRQEELLSAMRKHGLSKKHRRDAWIWWRVASTFEHDYSGDPRHLFEQFGYDAPRLFTAMGAAFKKKFPYLSGPKILPLWLRMLHDVCKIPFKGLNKIPIPVDIHICRASLALGVLQGKYSGSISDIFSAIDEAWRQGCEGLPFYRLQVDEPLWHQSKNGCTHRPKSSCLPEDCPQYIACPVARYCITGKVSVTSNRVEIDT